MPDPPKERMFSQIYEDANPVLAAQREEFLSYAASFEGGGH
jgi:pyruvate dehydrogenase E1 component alpha subunit